VNWNTGNESKEIQISKSELISMHTARRTWNTKAEKSGRNTFAIMREIGHKNIGVHSGYVKYDLDDAKDEMRGMWD